MYAQSAIDQTINDSGKVASVLQRLRREPGLRGWVLTAPTRTLAALGISLDDEQLVELLEEIEAMDDRALPLTARELMTTNVITISAGSSTNEAARVLADNRISGLPVLAPDGSVAGVLSVYDLLAKPGTTVDEVMSRKVTTVLDTAALSSVRATLVSQHVRRVPVVDSESHLVGIISLGDLVRELAYR
jgi:CBS domain-containing protein